MVILLFKPLTKDEGYDYEIIKLWSTNCIALKQYPSY